MDRITELGPRGVPGDGCTPRGSGNVALDHRGEVRSLLFRILLTMGCTAIGSPLLSYQDLFVMSGVGADYGRMKYKVVYLFINSPLIDPTNNLFTLSGII